MLTRKNFVRLIAIAAIVILILLSLAPIVYVFAPQPGVPASTPVPPIGQPASPQPIDVGQ